MEYEAARRERREGGVIVKLAMVSADFEENTITVLVPDGVMERLAFAPCELEVDLGPLVELARQRHTAAPSSEERQG